MPTGRDKQGGLGGLRGTARGTRDLRLGPSSRESSDSSTEALVLSPKSAMGSDASRGSWPHDEPSSSLAAPHKASGASEGTALTTEGESWSHTQEAAGSLRHITLPSVAGSQP